MNTSYLHTFNGYIRLFIFGKSTIEWIIKKETIYRFSISFINERPKAYNYNL